VRLFPALACAALFLACAACDGRPKAAPDPAAGLVACADLYAAYFRDNPGFSPILAIEGDVNADGAADLVALYHDQDGNSWMRVLLRGAKGGYIATNAHKAPVENQSARFRDIDDKPPCEFIVQGMKGAKSGFAIYRVENGELTDVFGEGMDECC